MLKCGIVGLPNVGKSTLFNALTATAAAEAANYPFCTIEPNTGVVNVPDARLVHLASIANSQKIIPTQIEFVDIAGLVKGASKGEGLGNQFLSHIREVDAVIHVLRCFDNENITHIEGKIDPIRDLEIISTELLLADLESIEKRLPNVEKKFKSGRKELLPELELMRDVYDLLSSGRAARELPSSHKQYNNLKLLQLITAKPVIYVCNLLENEASSGNNYTEEVKNYLKDKFKMVIISSKIESEISLLENEDEKNIFLQDIGLKESGISQIIKSGYNILDLRTFFTIGPKEAHAWTIKSGYYAPQAAGVIHTDFEKGFIRAETISYQDYIKYHGEQGAKDSGKMRLEGKEYIVNDGDIMHFRFNV